MQVAGRLLHLPAKKKKKAIFWVDDKIWIFTSYLAGGQKKLSVIWLHLINYWSPSTNVTLFLCKHPHLLCLLEQDSVLLLTWEGQCEKKRILVTDSCANVITCIKPLLDCASPLMIPFCHDFRLCEMNFFLTWDERPVADCSSGEECQKKSVKSQDGTGSRSIINKPWRGTADAGKSKHLLFFHKWFQRCCQASVSMITPWLLSQQQHFADYFSDLWPSDCSPSSLQFSAFQPSWCPGVWTLCRVSTQQSLEVSPS